MTTLHWPALVTLATLALSFATAAIVGKARVKYGIKAPATIGHELFERAALWLCALYFGPLTATTLGALWLVGRIWYAAAYLREPKSRGNGFVLAYAAWGGLMLAASWGVLRALLAG